MDSGIGPATSPLPVREFASALTRKAHRLRVTAPAPKVSSSAIGNHNVGLPLYLQRRPETSVATISSRPLQPEAQISQVNTQIDSPAPPISYEVLNSPGEPLDSAAREFIEPRFGRDFSNVRVHTDARAAESADALNAVAYAGDTHLVFGRGHYEPASAKGRRLLAHELTHVVQQQSGLPLKSGVVKGGDAYERQAETVGDLVGEGGSAKGVLPTGAGAPRRASQDSGTMQCQAIEGDPVKGAKTKSTGGYQWSPNPAATSSSVNTPSAVMTYSGDPLRNFQVVGSKTLDEIARDIRGIGENAKKGGVKGDVQFGTFANASLNVAVPIPQVPGLSLTIEFEGDYARFGSGEQELELKQSLGVKYSFFDFFSVSAEEFQYLKLEGANLGDAFIDAIKQITRRILILEGVEKELIELAGWKDLSVFEKVGDLFIDMLEHPILGRYIQIAKIASSQASPKQIQEAYKAYCKFFTVDPTVGFEAGFGGALSAEADVGDELGAKVSGEAIAGIEDVDKVKATEFAEIAFAGGGKVNDSELQFRLSKRWRADGSQRVAFELEGDFPGFAGASKQIENNIKLFLKSGACLSAFGTTAASDKEGEDGTVDMNALIQTAVTLIPIKAANKKFGLDLSFENDVDGGKSTWSAAVRIKEIQEFENSLKRAGVGVDMKLQYGSFIDISGEIESYLNQVLGGPASKAARTKAAMRRTKVH